jgi:acyl carrier protein
LTYDDKIAELKKQMSEILEISESNLEKVNMSDIAEYDSMGKINVSLIIEDLFEYEIDFDTLDSAEKFSDICNILAAKDKG